jgi:hypothetical protein
MVAAEVTAEVAGVPMAAQVAGGTTAAPEARIMAALENRVVAPMRAAVKVADDLIAEGAMAEAPDRKRAAV